VLESSRIDVFLFWKEAMLEIIQIYKSYEGAPLLRGLTFNVEEDETVCLLGASGSGKSTLLRIIAGLESPEQGRVCWDGEDLSSVAVHQRGFGLVFQDFALFPHLNVAENVAFGLQMLGMPREEVVLRVGNMLEKVNLSGFERRRVTDLSGGEQQRVALARALAPNPRLLMLDEPLGALDRNLREQLMAELRQILHVTHIPAIYVTHDQEEAFTLADRVLLLHDGEIIRSGKPQEVWMYPGSAWAARFLDIGNVIEGILIAGDGALRLDTAAGVFEISCRHPHIIGDTICILVRPQGGRRVTNGSLKGVVVDTVLHGDRFKVTLENGLYFYLPEAPMVGERIHLAIDPEAVQCLS
jgi:ABC-type Fe3+/spermidine/putrescine transport system ATPase subunit